MKKIAIILLLAFLFTLRGNIPSSAEISPKNALKTPRVYSHLLLKKAEELHRTEAIELIQRSLKIDPDNPRAHFLIFRHTFGKGLKDTFLSFKHLFNGIRYSIKDFWHFLNFYAIVLATFSFSIPILIVIFAVVRLPIDIPLFIHEITEDPKKVAFLGVLIPSFLGVYFALAGILFLSSFQIRKRGYVIGPILFGLMLLSMLIGGYLDSYLRGMISPEIRATAAVNLGRSNIYAIDRLKNTEGFTYKFSYALALQKEGYVTDARPVYEDLAREKKDERVLVNLGNCYFLLNQYDNAEALYREALKIKPIASAYYNLSIIARERLNFSEGDSYFVKAVGLDFARVTRFRELWSDTKYVEPMSEQLRKSELMILFLQKSMAYFGFKSRQMFFAVYVLILSVLLIIRGKERTIAQRCPKCGKVYCLKCERRLYWGGLCSECFRSLVTFETDPSERVKRLLNSYNYQRRRRQFLSILSFIIPGFALMGTENVMRGVLFLFGFIFFVVMIFVSGVFVLNIYPESNSWLKIIAFIAATLVYIFSVLSVRGRIRKGWL